MHSDDAPRLGLIAACWAIAGWAGVLAFAIGRLSVTALEGLAMELSGFQLAVLAANTVLLAWSEGYRGFQQRFSPRAAARVLWLRRHATPLTALLAPAFCIGLFGAAPRVLRMTWIGAGLIVLAVLLVQRLDQPWRGIVDAGVVVGLAWGLVSFLVLCRSALASGRYPADPALPAARAAA